jgi:hypothetical protein
VVERAAPGETIMSRNAADNDVFVYTGEGGAIVPDDVVRVRVDPSVTSIPACAFEKRNKLAEVELCEGLVEIGRQTFENCRSSIKKINIPNSLKRICDYAFSGSVQCPIRLHNGIESIGRGAFDSCIFTNFRIPPLITAIPDVMLYYCKSLFSLELPEDVTEIGTYAFSYCYHLRNVSFPPNADLDDNIFAMFGGQNERYDLYQLFGSIAEIISKLQHRFDRLPIHRLVYYQSYHQGVLQMLIAAINLRSGQHRTLRSKLDPTGNQHDCLGMTPLHILTCSSVHDIEVYRVIIDNYPTNLITEDRWGALPLLYAFWGAAPTEIIQFLLTSYRLHYPNYMFNWTLMVNTIGWCDTPKESIGNLLCVKQMHFPEQAIDWEYLLDEFSNDTTQHPFWNLFQERMQFLVMCGMSESVGALAFKVWRNQMTNMIQTAEFQYNENGNYHIIQRIRAKLAHFEAELPKLKEITTILELALWKLRMNDFIPQEKSTRRQKKMKTDESCIRRQFRITCGADVVVGHVLPYLIIVADEEPTSYAESDSDSTSDNESNDSM